MWPFLVGKGLGLPQRNPVLVHLDEHKKLKRLLRNAFPRLDSKARKAFTPRGRRNVRDDVHLYEAAASGGSGIVVTEDAHLLARAGDLLRATGVETLAPDEF